MPVNGTRVTVLYAYALPGPVQSFSAKTAAEVAAEFTITHQQMRYYRAPRGFPARSVILAMLLGQQIHTGLPRPNPENANWTGEPVKIEVTNHDEQRESREDAERGHGTRPRTN